MTKHIELPNIENEILNNNDEKKKNNEEKIKKILLILKGMTASEASALLYKVGQQMVIG